MSQTISPGSIGRVIHRPEGTEALLWQAYARALEQKEQQAKQIARLKRKAK